MANCVVLLVSLTILLSQSILAVHEENPLTVFLEDKPYKLHMTKTGLNKNQADAEVEELHNNRQLQAVLITNVAKDWFRIFCSSEYDHVFDNQRMNVGDSVLFEFEPQPSKEEIVFQCGLDYKGFFAIWDVASEIETHSDQNQQLYHYFILHDGVYINGIKIHGLGSSENRYSLCKDNFVTEIYPDCISGFVNEDMCNNLPSWISDQVSSVSVDDFGCVILYDDYNCSGNSKEVVARKRVPTRNFLGNFKNKTSSVKGCSS